MNEAELVAELERLEQRLDPARPERVAELARVIGYGEISTVLALVKRPELVLKRMAGFRSAVEVEDYVETVCLYVERARARGVRMIETRAVAVASERNGRVVYLVQPAIEAKRIGHRVLQQGDSSRLERLMRGVLDSLASVWRANRKARAEGDWELALDGQISNWALDPEAEQGGRPVYFDVGTPLLRRGGVERLNADLFLRAAPAPLRPLLRRFVLPPVAARYYEPAAVVTDLLANFIKEGCAERIPLVLGWIRAWAAREGADLELALPDEAAVRAYYRTDAHIWSLYLGLRRLDRAVKTRLLGRRYEYLLPGRIRRY